MRNTICCVVLAFCALATPAFGQDEGGGFSGGRGGSGLPSDINLPRTIPQQFAIKLKLDRTQQPQVDAILTAAAAEAVQPTQEMLQVRQRLLNALRSSHPEEAKAAEAAYAVAAAKGVKVEAAASQGVHAAQAEPAKGSAGRFRADRGFVRQHAARGSGRPGGPGGAGAAGAPGGRGGAFPFSRFELLVQYLKLDGDKKKAAKTEVDNGHKAAAPARDGLLKAHAALGAVVEAGAEAEALDRAAAAYGVQAATMARLEVEALSAVIGIADPDLQNRDGIQASFFLFRGMFLRGKWDEIPDPNLPSY